jgi:hypothetical protein
MTITENIFNSAKDAQESGVLSKDFAEENSIELRDVNSMYLAADWEAFATAHPTSTETPSATQGRIRKQELERAIEQLEKNIKLGVTVMEDLEDMPKFLELSAPPDPDKFFGDELRSLDFQCLNVKLNIIARNFAGWRALLPHFSGSPSSQRVIRVPDGDGDTENERPP